MRVDNQCMTNSLDRAYMGNCASVPNQSMSYDRTTHQIKNGNKCLHMDDDYSISFKICVNNEYRQKWWYDRITRALRNVGYHLCVDMLFSYRLIFHECHYGGNQQFQVPSGWTIGDADYVRRYWSFILLLFLNTISLL